MKLLVGLGNPGAKYETTRHNAGFLVLDLIADDLGASWSSSKFEAQMAKGQLFGEQVVLLKPTTFMNLSGRSVSRAMQFFKLKPEDVVILHDDIDMSSGKIKTSLGSSGHGGHNGMRSIMQETGKNTFCRLKLGVGRPSEDQKIDVASWVLQSFSDEELLSLQNNMYDAVMLRLKGILQP